MASDFLQSITVYLDSDVVISALLSQKGAAFWLMQEIPGLKIILSSLSMEEIVNVTNRKAIDIPEGFFSNVELCEIEPTGSISSEFNKYVNDPNDRFIVYSAMRAQVDYLITYNVKDYKLAEILTDFNIITHTPGDFLQYLRFKGCI